VTRAVSEPWDEGSDAIDVTLSQLRGLLLQRHPAPPQPWDGSLDAFLAWRLATGVVARPDAPLRTVPVRDGHFDSMPPLCRSSMAPEPMERRLLRRWFGRLRGGPTAGARREFRRRRRALHWTRVAFRRRLLLATLVLLPTIIASGFMVNVLPRGGSSTLEFVIVVVFGVLSLDLDRLRRRSRASTAFVRGDQFAITRAGDGAAGEAVFLPTAIVMPIATAWSSARAPASAIEESSPCRRCRALPLSCSATPPRWRRWCEEEASRVGARRRRLRPHLLSLSLRALVQEWQRRPAGAGGDIHHGDARRRQRDAGSDAGAWSSSGDASDVGIVQTVPVAVSRRSPSRACSSSRVALRADVLRRLALAARRRPVLGPTRSNRRRRSSSTAPASPGKPRSAARSEPTSSRRPRWVAPAGRPGSRTISRSYDPVDAAEEMSRDRRWKSGQLAALRLLFTEGFSGVPARFS
jgi:hypothetical protein